MDTAIQRRERERLAAGPLAGGQSAAAVLLAEGEGGGGDATDGAFLGSGAAAEACHQDRGDHFIDLGIQAGAGSLGSNRLRAIGQLISRQAAASPAPSATVGPLVANVRVPVRSTPPAAPQTPAPVWGRRISAPATGRSPPPASGGSGGPSAAEH
jgi:hypothetical protein